MIKSQKNKNQTRTKLTTYPITKRLTRVLLEVQDQILNRKYRPKTQNLSTQGETKEHGLSRYAFIGGPAIRWAQEHRKRLKRGSPTLAIRTGWVAKGGRKGSARACLTIPMSVGGGRSNLATVVLHRRHNTRENKSANGRLREFV